MGTLAEAQAVLAEREKAQQKSTANLESARAILAEREKQEPSIREQVNKTILENPVGRTAAELGSAITRGATETADFFLDIPRGVQSLTGNEPLPQVTDVLSPATTGEFMEPGLARDVVRSGGELVAPGGVAGKTAQQIGKIAPKIQSASESVAQGVARQIGQTSVPAEAAFSGLAGAGAEVGGEIGEELGGDKGRSIGEQIGGVLSPLSASIVSNTGRRVTTRSARALLKESAPTTEGLKDTARTVYREIDDLGAVVKSSETDRLARRITQTVTREGYHPRLHPKVAVTLDELAKSEGKDLTVTEIDIIRKIAKSAEKSLEPDEQRIGKIVTASIDDFLDNLKQGSFSRGGGEVGALYKDARQLWSRAKKSELLEEAFTKARDQATGFENGLRVQFRAILNSKKKRVGFTQDEIQAMQQVVRGTSAANTAKMLGRFGFSEGQASNMMLGSLGVAGGAAGGAALGIGASTGAIIVPAIGTVSRKLAQKLTANNARLAQAVVKAGKNGPRIIAEYMRAVAKADRDPIELGELLKRPEIGLAQISRRVASLPKEQRQIVNNAVFYAEALRETKDNDQ